MAKEIGTIEQALEDLRQGKVILVIDDPRERERRRSDLCGRICNTGKCKPYGMQGKRTDLHANERRTL